MEGTFFMKPRNRRLLSILAENTAAREVIKGRFIPSAGMLETEKVILESLVMSRTIQDRGQIATCATGEDFRGHFRKAKEKTASSFLTLHFGHYKTATENSDLIKIHAGMLDIAATTGSTLPWWHQGLTVMIYKKKNSINIDDLRAIVLMEADFNMLNKLIIGQEMTLSSRSRSSQENVFQPHEDVKVGWCCHLGGRAHMLQ